MSTPDILPCPFCGGQPRVEKLLFAPRTYYAVHCDCDVMKHTADEWCGEGWPTLQGAIEAWNARPEATHK